MASLTHALIGNGSKRSSSYSRESRLRLVRRECKPLSVTVGASNRSASDRKPISRASHPSKRREKNSSLFSLHLSHKCFVTFRNSRAYFSRFLERLVVKRNETKSSITFHSKSIFYSRFHHIYFFLTLLTNHLLENVQPCNRRSRFHSNRETNFTACT